MLKEIWSGASQCGSHYLLLYQPQAKDIMSQFNQLQVIYPPVVTLHSEQHSEHKLGAMLQLRCSLNQGQHVWAWKLVDTVDTMLVMLHNIVGCRSHQIFVILNMNICSHINSAVHKVSLQSSMLIKFCIKHLTFLIK